MNRLFALALGGFLIALTGFAGAADDDNAKKIIGKWEVTKSGSDLPAGSTIEFTKDGKLLAIIKGDDNTKIEGTYKVEKGKMTVKIKGEGNQTHEEVVTILKLTDTALETKDKDGKIDAFKKVK
jgi:uncharacterized protein (TIGR03066 family)